MSWSMIPWRRLTALVAVAVAGSLVPVGPALARTPTPACPVAVESTGFTDVIGLSSVTVEAIDCIAHHGVTAGTTPITYEPATPVARWQMAVFLVRAAQSLRIVIPTVSTSPFADLTGVDPVAQRAIAQLAALGITVGTSATTFSPYDPVSRWEMAVFLARLLVKAGVVLPPSPTHPYADLGGLSPTAVLSINQITQLGLAAGTAPGTFSPHAAVGRGDMAVFLARALDAGGARPWRVSLALSANQLPVFAGGVATVTVVKPTGAPFPGVLVDVFATQGFATDGTCAIDVDARLNGIDGGTSSDCRIDVGDPRTDSDGVVRVGLAHDAVSETDIIVAWVGTEGQTFDADTVPDRPSQTITWAATAEGLTLGTGVSATFGGNANVVTQLIGTTSAVSDQLIGFEVVRNGVVVVQRTLTTTSGGAATLTYQGPADPGVGDDPAVIDVVTAFWDRNGNGVDDGAAEFDAVTTVTWDDP